MISKAVNSLHTHLLNHAPLPLPHRLSYIGILTHIFLDAGVLFVVASGAISTICVCVYISLYSVVLALMWCAISFVGAVFVCG